MVRQRMLKRNSTTNQPPAQMPSTVNSDEELDSEPPSDQSTDQSEVAESVETGKQKRKRAEYPTSFKCEVVRIALKKPANRRIKPTAREFPGVQPVQVRRWLRTFAPALEQSNEGSEDGLGDNCDERAEECERECAMNALWQAVAVRSG